MYNDDHAAGAQHHGGAAGAGRALILATPLQLMVVLVVGLARYQQLPCCLMLQTLAFVAFNKVCVRMCVYVWVWVWDDWLVT